MLPNVHWISKKYKLGVFMNSPLLFLWQNKYNSRFFCLVTNFNIICILALYLFLTACSNSSPNGQNKADISPSEIPKLTNQLDILSISGAAKYEETDLIAHTLSPDDNHLYAFAKNGKENADRLVYFTLDISTGNYEYTKKLIDGVDFEYVSSMLVSPDGNHVYVSHENGIAVFTRDANSGGLIFNSEQTNLMVDGGISADQIILTPDGNYLYARSWTTGEILIFNRNSTSGELTYLDRQEYTSGTTDRLIISQDSNYLYIVGQGVNVSTIEKTTGYLTLVQEFGSEYLATGEFVNFGMISDISFNESENELYIYGEIRNRNASGDISFKEGILIASRDEQSGLLSYGYASYISDQRYRVGELIEARMVVNGDLIYVLSIEPNSGKSASVFLHLFSQNSVSGYELTSTDPLESMVGLRQSLPSIMANTLGDTLLASFKQGGKIFQFDLNSLDGSVQSTTQLVVDVDENDGLYWANYSVVSPDGKNIYVTSGRSNISAYGFDSATGDIEFVQTVFIDSVDFLPEYPYFSLGPYRSVDVAFGSMAISPDGAFVYIIGQNKILRMSRNPETGFLSRTEGEPGEILDFSVITSGDTTPTDVPVYYAAEETGYGQFYLESMVMSPDGMYLYVGGLLGNDNAAIAVLERDLTTGELRLVEVIDTATGIYTYKNWKPRVISVSNDGEHVYFANQLDGALFNLKKDPVTGWLSILQVFQGIELIDVSNIVSVNSDKYVYVSADEIALSPSSFGGLFQNTVSMLVFSRDETTGELVLMQVLEKDGEDTDGNVLNSQIIQGGARYVIANPDGNELYVLTQKQRTIYETKQDNGYRLDVYLIDQNNGMLRLVQMFDEGHSGLGISSIATSIGGDHLFVTNERYNSITVLKRNNVLQ
jgi:6-phosphogluconolactonase (cycloisomerase 2 family)